MAGDEDRPSSEAQAIVTPPHDDAGPAPQTAVDDRPSAPAGREPAVEPGRADLAAAERPAEGFGAQAGAPGTHERPPAQPRSIMPTVLSLIGVALILLLGANLYGLYNPPENPAIPALQSDVAALKQQVAAVAKVDLGPLEGRVAAVGTDLAQLKADLARNAGAVDAATAGAKAALAPLAAKVADLDTSLGALQGSVAALPKVDLAPLDSRLADLDKRLGPLDDRIADIDKRTAPFDGRIADLDKRLVPLEAYFNAPKSDARVTEARQNGSAAETRAAPVAVIAQGVQQAIIDGRPFATETRALATLGVEPALLAPLDAVAAKGAASQADLIAGFGSLQGGIVVAAAPVKTGTMLDRIMANAQSLVTVTRTGAGTGGQADAVASRIDADLRRGALPAAAAEWDGLPEASKSASADWAARLKTRIAADDAARMIAAQAVAALAAVQ